VSYKRQALLTLLEHLGSPPVFDGVRGDRLFVLCFCLFVVVLCLVCTHLQVSVDCPLLTSHSVKMPCFKESTTNTYMKKHLLVILCLYVYLSSYGHCSSHNNHSCKSVGQLKSHYQFNPVTKTWISNVICRGLFLFLVNSDEI
jgi:hypothetical protein